ncbi:Sodium-independent sulfate anion transporter, partial [Gryllus bimaculatus]
MWTAAARRLAGRHLPITRWLPSYSAADAAGDALAGLTVGLTLVPQAVAYAALAGLPPQYGLYSALPGGLVYAVLGTCTEISTQLTALVALLTAASTSLAGPDAAVLLCFLAGAVQLLCGLLRLGFLVDLVSAPVVQGFTLAAAVTIASSQLKALLGLSFQAQGFVDTWRLLVRHAPATRPADAALALCCVAALIALRALKDARVEAEAEAEAEVEVEEASAKRTRTRRRRVAALKRSLWLLATGRNALVVLLAAGLTAALMKRGDSSPFLLSGTVHPGLPPVQAPPFTTTYQNRTFSFPELCEHLGSAIVSVPIVSILGNVAIAKAFARGRVVDASQEMLALGACNLVASFFRSAPVAGSFSCSAVSQASGVRTPLAAVYTAGLVALSLAFLTQYFIYIPRAALAAVVVSAVIFMADFRSLAPMWRTSRWDLLPLGATFVASLALGVAQGLLAGVAVDVALLLFFTARPRITARTLQCEGAGSYVLVAPAGGLSFPCVDHVRGAVVRALARAAAAGERPAAAVLDLAHAARADFSAALGLAALAAELRCAPAPAPLLVLANARSCVAAAVAAAAAPAPPPLLAHNPAEL